MIRLFIVLIVLFVCTFNQKLTLDLKTTEAILYTNDLVVLKFKCEGGVGEKKFEFTGIPSNWRINKNDLVIYNYTVGDKQEWSFQVYVVDENKNYLKQTIKVIFQGFNVELIGVTLPKTGNQSKNNDDLDDQEESSEASNSEGFNLNQLIQQYPGLQENQGFSFPNNSEIAPYIIKNAQATYDPERDGRKISETEKKRNAAIQRQLNANKAVANLLNIIQKITANINTAIQEITDFEREVKEKKDDLFNCNEEIFSLQNVRAKILNAVNDKRVKMNQYEKQIQENQKKLQKMENQLSKNKVDRLQIEKKDSPTNRELQQLESTLSKCDNILDEDKAKIESVINDINKNNADINILQIQISESKNRIRQLSKDLNLVRKKIDELKKQLAEAESEEKQIVKEAAYYNSIPIQGYKKIQVLKLKNTNLYRQISTINNSIKRRLNECQKTKQRIDEIRNKLALSKLNYQTLAKLIQNKEKQIKNTKQTIQFYRENSARIPIELAALEIELNKYKDRIKRQQYVCGVAEEDLGRAQINLKAIQEKYIRDSEALQKVKLEFEKARAQQQLADLAVLQFLSSVAPGVLPFSQQPKVTGSYPTVKQLGNDFKVSTVSSRTNAVSVGNLDQYVSASFRFTVELSKDPILYPLGEEERKKITSSVSRTSGLSNFSCQKQRKSNVGKVEKATLGTVQVRDTRNRKFSLSLSKCTIISSTDPDIFFAKGTKVYFSGAQVFALPGTILFDAYELLLLPN